VEETFKGQTYAVWNGGTNQVIKARAGRLAKVIVYLNTTSGTLTVYDNPSAASGTVLFVSPSTPTSGTIYDVDMPARTGMYLVTPTGGAGLVVFS